MDNLAKSCLDAGNGILYRDDRQVAELAVRKACGDREEIHMTVRGVSTE